MHRIEAGRLIPGHGAPVSDGVVVLDGPSEREALRAARRARALSPFRRAG